MKRFCWLHWYLGTLLAICLLATVAAFTLVGLIYEWCSRAPERKYAGSGKGALMPKVRDRAAAGTPVIVNWGAAEPSLHVASAATFSRGNSAMRSR